MTKTDKQSKPDGDLPLRALRYFIEVVQRDRYADAATRLGVTSSAVSHQIRALEDWIGGQLLDRETKKPMLTDLGRALHDGAAEPMRRIERVMAAVRRFEDDGRLVISAPPAFVSFRLIPSLAGFRSAHPEIKIDFRLVRFDAEVEPFSADIAIRFIHGHPTARRLGVAGWRAVCTPGYDRTLGHPRRLGDLEGAVLLHEDIYNFWPEAFRAKGLDMPADVTFRALGDASHVLSSLLAGDAMALLPNELTRGLRRDGALVSPFDADIEPDAAYYAIAPDVRSKRESLATVFRWLAASS